MNITVPPIDPLKLCLTKSYSDGIAGEILEVIPVLNPLGVTTFMGRTNVQIPNVGNMQVMFKLAALALADAVIEWPEACRKAVVEALEDHQSKQLQNKILNPGQVNGRKKQ